MSAQEKIPVGISQCLLGDPVRFNGGHKHLKLCTQVLNRYFEFIPTCPEVNIGLGVPRKPIRLIATDSSTRAVETEDYRRDYTDQLSNQAHRYHAEHQELCGFIAAGGSPSCSAYSAKIYNSKGVPEGKVAGVFTAALTQQNPLLPVEDSGRLNDPGLRENFILRVFTYHRWCQLNKAGLTPQKLIEFHSQHKYLVLSHNTVAYQTLGRLLSNMAEKPMDAVAPEYIHTLMSALAKPPRRGQHCNVLHHMMGYLKNLLSSKDKQELAATIEDYRQGIVPLVVPLALLRHHLDHYQSQLKYVLKQVYLSPYPYELGLRSLIV